MKDSWTASGIIMKGLTEAAIPTDWKGRIYLWLCSGKQFDPAIAEIFVHMLERGVMKYINKRDIYIEYGPSIGIVVLFDRDDEGIKKV